MARVCAACLELQLVTNAQLDYLSTVLSGRPKFAVHWWARAMSSLCMHPSRQQRICQPCRPAAEAEVLRGL